MENLTQASARRSASGLGALLCLLAGGTEAAACTHAYGIPGECRMSAHTLDTNPDPARRAMPKRIAQADMIGRWTFNAFDLSPDGEALVFHRGKGITLDRGAVRLNVDMDLRRHNPREFSFSPDSKRLAFWAPEEPGLPAKRVALAALGGERFRHHVIYTPAAGWSPWALEWAPTGDALLVLEKSPAASALRRVALDGSVKALVEGPEAIDFVLVSPRVAPKSSGVVLIGRASGIVLIDAASGQVVERLPGLPSTGVAHFDWNREANSLALFFHHPTRDAQGRLVEGLYHLDLDALAKRRRLGRAAQPLQLADYAVQLSRGRNLHTLWYSPRGDHLAWGTSEGAFVWKLGDPAQTQRVVEIPKQGATGETLELKGLAWKPDQSQLVLTAENEVWIQTLSQAPRLYRIAQSLRGFCAQPQWRAGKVVVSRYEPVKLKRKGLPLAPPFPR